MTFVIIVNSYTDNSPFSFLVFIKMMVMRKLQLEFIGLPTGLTDALLVSFLAIVFVIEDITMVERHKL